MIDADHGHAAIKVSQRLSYRPLATACYRRLHRHQASSWGAAVWTARTARHNPRRILWALSRVLPGSTGFIYVLRHTCFGGGWNVGGLGSTCMPLASASLRLGTLWCSFNGGKDHATTESSPFG
jgi:hypothetical protein